MSLVDTSIPVAMPVSDTNNNNIPVVPAFVMSPNSVIPNPPPKRQIIPNFLKNSAYKILPFPCERIKNIQTQLDLQDLQDLQDKYETYISYIQTFQENINKFNTTLEIPEYQNTISSLSNIGSLVNSKISNDKTNVYTGLKQYSVLLKSRYRDIKNDFNKINRTVKQINSDVNKCKDQKKINEINKIDGLKEYVKTLHQLYYAYYSIIQFIENIFLNTPSSGGRSKTKKSKANKRKTKKQRKQ